MKENKKSKNKASQMLDYLKFSSKFKTMSDEEKKLFICQSKNVQLLEMFITDEEAKIECYCEIYREDVQMYLDKVYEVLMATNNDSIKNKYVSLLQNEEQKKEIILSINDLLIRGVAIECLSEENQIQVIETINDDEILRHIHFITKNLRVFCAIKDDDTKEMGMKDFSLDEQTQVICSFVSDEKKYLYTKNGMFNDYLADITKSIKEFGYVKRVFHDHDDVWFKLDVINNVRDLKNFNELVGMLPASIYKDLFFASRKQNKAMILKQMSADKKLVDNNSGLTFQIAFDVDVNNALGLLDFNRIFDNWSVEKDGYGYNKVRITSPKLSYSEEGFKEVQYIYDFLRKYNCMPIVWTNNSLKFNFDYLTSLEEFFDFMKLYTYSEETIRAINSSMGKLAPNNGILPFYLLLKHILAQYGSLSKDCSLYQFVEQMNLVTDSHNYSLNLTDCCSENGMIEFKVPIDNFDFKEFSNTIKLYARLLEKTKLLSMIKQKNDAINSLNRIEALKAKRNLICNYCHEKSGLFEIISVLNEDNENEILNNFENLCNNNLENNDRLLLLLRLLFGYGERQVYRNRYYDGYYNHYSQTYNR